MSRLCAKPTCSGAAVRWLNLNAAEQQVIEQAQPTESTIALCASHAQRFSMPNGWEWVGVVVPEAPLLTEEPELTNEIAESAKPDPAPRRRHGRDAPWFLANSDASPRRSASSPAASTDQVAVHAVAGDATDTPEVADDAKISEGDIAVPSTGSLLHRAFHGPDADADVARAKRDAHLNSGTGSSASATSAQREQRTASESTDSSGGSDDDEVAPVRDIASRRAASATPSTSYDVELPFPPADPGPHVAVS